MTVWAAVIQRQARRVDLVPACLPGPVLAGITPEGFLGRAGGTQLLAAFERVVSEFDQHPCGPHPTQPDHLHLGQVVGLPGPVCLRSGLPQDPVGRLVLRLGPDHGGQTSHWFRRPRRTMAPGWSAWMAVRRVMTSSTDRPRG